MKEPMQILRVELGQRGYDICIGHGCLSDLGRRMTSLGFSSKAAIISNPTVAELYGSTTEQSLVHAGFESTLAFMGDGEEYKTLQTASDLWDMLLVERLDRKSPVVALGGGVVGDVAGFIAATYMRGIPYIQVPTTLLAQVDSSVGGKVGIDHKEGKNLIGSFYQPCLVWIDTRTLQTLPAREIRCGMAEVVKYGVIADADFFQFLEQEMEEIQNLNPETLSRVIYRCCQIKAEVVSQDETETGIRAILNFGHTIGHAIETLSDYQDLKHGEGVALGMLAETRLAMNRGICDREVYNRLLALLERIGLPVKIPPMDCSRLIHIMTVDKKSQQRTIRMVLPTRMGQVLLPQPVEPVEVQTALQQSMQS